MWSFLFYTQDALSTLKLEWYFPMSKKPIKDFYYKIFTWVNWWGWVCLPAWGFWRELSQLKWFWSSVLHTTLLHTVSSCIHVGKITHQICGSWVVLSFFWYQEKPCTLSTRDNRPFIHAVNKKQAHGHVLWYVYTCAGLWLLDCFQNLCQVMLEKRVQELCHHPQLCSDSCVEVG